MQYRGPLPLVPTYLTLPSRLVKEDSARPVESKSSAPRSFGRAREKHDPKATEFQGAPLGTCARVEINLPFMQPPAALPVIKLLRAYGYGHANAHKFAPPIILQSPIDMSGLGISRDGEEGKYQVDF
jgi:hypothetical protein